MDNIYPSLPISSPVSKAVFWELCTSRRLAGVARSIPRGIPDIVTSRENLILSLLCIMVHTLSTKIKQLQITEKSYSSDFILSKK